MSQQLQGEAVSLIGSWSQTSEWQLPNFISSALAHSQQNAHSLHVEEWVGTGLQGLLVLWEIPSAWREGGVCEHDF